MAAARTVVWSPEAEQDLLDIWGYLADHASANAADDQLRLIGATCARLTEWPEAGRPRIELLEDVRSITAIPYVIFYRIRQEQLQILRVLHSRRDVEMMFSS